ncbi:heat-labile enterotoxin alpha chain-domain-containing protein [Nemania sp. FL0031]|nr:heat-labile enterotoxin alpha chain-domain-containing protein [Nemania sp. FL0031]
MSLHSSSFASGQQATVAQSPPKIVYRADLISPEDLKRQGSFLPKGMDGTRPFQPPADTSLYNHLQGTPTGTSRFTSGYVATTASLDFARRFLHTTLGGRGYIYRIHVSPNFIDAAGTLRQFYSHSEEEEFASLGPIHYSQVLGWTEFRQGVEQPEVLNPSYDTRYDQVTSGGTQYQLAGFPPNHVAWGLEPWRDFSNCGPSMGTGEETCTPEQSSLDYAMEYVGATYHADDLVLSIQLSDDTFAGTSDTILAKFGSSQVLTELLNAPSAGASAHVSINMRNAFGKDQVPLRDIASMSIVQRPVPHPIASDDFKIHGIWVQLHCVETGRRYRNMKYEAIDKWLGTNGPDEAVVWQGDISLGDWSVDT